MGLAQQVGEDKFFSQQDRNKAQSLFDKNAGTYDFITGPNGDPTKGKLYSSFLTKARESTTNAYDKAVMNSRTSAAGRGFGYASPNASGAELGIRAQEAGSLSGAPATALQETMPYQLEATSQRNQEAGQWNTQAGQYAGFENDAAKQQAANKSKMFSSLAGLAGNILGGPVGGMLAKKIFPGDSGSSDNGGGFADASLLAL